ncbi:MAG: Ig-like domain repeat protein [Microbacterium sp.]|uniref:Ig-like domain repeat protein n=1 Tax=Microbacterium sp. TaxID=51671 RepID=UPI0039E21B0F
MDETLHTLPRARTTVRRAGRAIAAAAAVALVASTAALVTASAASAATDFDYPTDYVENGVTEAPLLGWSSWSQQTLRAAGYNEVDGTSYSYSWLTADHVIEAADIMADKLASHGYEYVNIDAGWWREWDWTPEYDEYGRYAVDEARFPDGIESVIDYIHSLGLKVGIYVPVGMEKGAYDDGDFPIEGSATCTTHDAVYDDLRTTNGWDSSYALDFDNENGCAQAWIDSLTRQYADWGIDFLKIDGVGYGSGRSASNETVSGQYDNRADLAAWNIGFNKAGTDVTIALSWSLSEDDASDWQQLGDSWRISGDIEAWGDTLTTWRSNGWGGQVGGIVSRFSQAAEWAQYAGWDVGWNDLDSLLVGDPEELSGLTDDERRTAATLWAISAAPFYSGDDLTELDDLGLELLTNDEVLAIDQAGVPATPLGSTDDDEQVWVAQIDGKEVVALFNLADTATEMTVDYEDDLGLTGLAAATDVWAGDDLGTATTLTAAVPAHGTRLFEVTPAAAAATTVTLTASAAEQTYGAADTITLSADVSADTGGTPEGTVTFRTAAGTFASATVVDGVAAVTLPSTFEVGEYDAYATFEPADPSAFAASESSTSSFTVLAAPTTTSVTVDPSSAVVGDDVTVEVAVAATGYVPTGTVTLAWESSTGDTGSQSGVLTDGGVSFTVSGLAAGTYQLTAEYLGDADAAASSADPVELTVAATASTSSSSSLASTGSEWSPALAVGLALAVLAAGLGLTAAGIRRRRLDL